MKLSSLLRALEEPELRNYSDRSIGGLALDSRRVRQDYFFATVAGPRGDGAGYVPDAVARGAVAVLSSRPVEAPASVAQIIVPNVRRALADLSCRFYGRPADFLHVVGVTGTNGKTTVAMLVRSLLNTAGAQASLLSTVIRQIGSRRAPADNTTPESIELQSHFAQVVEMGIRYAVMEVSSHSLAQERVRGVPFRVGAWTNLTPNEHIDFHGSFEAYRDAKTRLFGSLAPGATAVLNGDDPNCPLFRRHAEKAGAAVMTFGLNGSADVRATCRPEGLDGMTAQLATPAGRREVRSPLIGEYNLLNLLAGTCCALALGLDLDAIATGIERFHGAPGRLERVSVGQPFTVLVDYAHNQAGMASVLGTLRPLTRGRLIVVFGAGGDREPSKRPLMGAVANEHADLAVVTADNSRSERTDDIIDQIVAGMPDERKRIREPDRRQAIRTAVGIAREGDVVAILGKGHETYQEFDGVRYPFDDRQEARRALENDR